MPSTDTSTKPPEPTPGLASGLAVVLPFVVAIAVGLPGARGTFIRDDFDYVTGNPHVACAASLRAMFTAGFQPLKPLGLYRPFTTLSLRCDAILGGEAHPWIFHATNLLLAGASAALVAGLARNLLARVLSREAAARGALVAGLLFAAHPARSEAVCWISGRAENLMTFFAVACLVLATGRESIVRTVLCALLAVCAAFSKEQGFVLAILVPAIAPPTSGKRLVQAVMVGGALGIAFALRWKVLQGVLLAPGLPAYEALTVPDRIAQGLRLLFEYARVAVWPHPLVFEYDARALRAGGFADPRVVAGGLLCAALAVATFARGRPLLRSGAALFLFPLIPVLHFFVPIGEDFAERFLALPVAGVALLAAAFAARLPVIGFGAGILAVAASGALFTVRAADYRSERALYENLLVKAPGSPSAKALLASTLLLPEGGTQHVDPRDLARAETLLREAVEADPGLAPARITLAALGSQRRASGRLPPLPADVEFMIETARLFPKLPQANGMLGVALWERGAPDLARPALERELAVMPLDLTAASVLARILEEQREEKRAQEVIDAVRARWETAWKRFPGFGPVAIAYARTLSDGGRDIDGARAVLREAAKGACRPSDRRAIEAALASIGG